MTKNHILITVVFLIVIAIFVFATNALLRDEPEETPLPPEQKEEVSPQAIEREPVQVPEETSEAEAVTSEEPLQAAPASLDGSDRAFLDLVNTLSPKLVGWLLPDEQIRKWVMTIDLIADGKIPRRYIPTEYNMPSYKVIKKDGSLYPNESNYQRSEALIHALVAIPPETAADYVAHWASITDSAYKELGKPGSFEERLQMAINQILAVEPLPKKSELKQPLVFYVYADETLENASDVEKLMWRLGPENTEAVQKYLQSLQVVLNKRG